MSDKFKIDQAFIAAKEFTTMYYERVDKQRHSMSELYIDSGLLTWNGNDIKGVEAIHKFYIDLPESEHVMNTLNAQPLLDCAVNGKVSFLIQVGGIVKYFEKTPKSFVQTFIIVQEDKLKIDSDTFKLMETP